MYIYYECTYIIFIFLKKMCLSRHWLALSLSSIVITGLLSYYFLLCVRFLGQYYGDYYLQNVITVLSHELVKQSSIFFVLFRTIVWKIRNSKTYIT